MCKGAAEVTVLNYAELEWNGKVLWPDRFEIRKRWLFRIALKDGEKKYSHYVKDTADALKIRMAPGEGKVTDCGYDQMACWYTALKADDSFIFTAHVTIRQLHGFAEPIHNAGAGLFIRDTLQNDRATGFPYSNMAAVGCGPDGAAVFVRSGITADSIETVHNHEIAGYALLGAERCIRIEKRQNLLKVSITDEEGRSCMDVDPEETGSGSVCLAVPEEVFSAREAEQLYLGFYAARGMEIDIQKSSVSVMTCDEKAVNSVKRLFVSPGGVSSASGTEADPLDIESAMQRCAEADELVLLPGRYKPAHSIVVGKEKSGRAGRPRRLVCQDAVRGAVLDFGGRMDALILEGDHWQLEGISVTNGMGIQIRGSHNLIRSCKAYRNTETGILIRAERIESERSEWPAGNTVEDCISYLNMDETENNADGFACKVAAGAGNRFIRCRAFLNSDDGFDLFTKNRKIGAVSILDCVSAVNGYKFSDEEQLVRTNGNGNGFKLGGSGLTVSHTVCGSRAVGNRGSGFTSNFNPVMELEDCFADANRGGDYRFFYSSPEVRPKETMRRCRSGRSREYDPVKWLEKEGLLEMMRNERI